jgi:hypothetical protein
MQVRGKVVRELLREIWDTAHSFEDSETRASLLAIVTEAREVFEHCRDEEIIEVGRRQFVTLRRQAGALRRASEQLGETRRRTKESRRRSVALQQQQDQLEAALAERTE